ncbi:MAG: hypothetical protein FWC43_11880 [Planctomycetaceae bacterium]|nr:hypothetical protein [Planctomycetaceae bacterium]MCL2306032.1 hypothetical protein [Planctomycetaceae bacterium]
MHESSFSSSEHSDTASENTDDEKKTVSPPPEVPEEITGNFTVVLESLPGSSPHLQPHKPHFAPTSASPQGKSRTTWNPFASRFSPQYVRLNRILTISAILLLVLALTGFNLIRQTRSLLTNNLLQVRVAMPGVLARQTQNTLAIDVSDWRGHPKRVPVRVSLLSETGEKIALYQEKTDSKGLLHLALESPANLSANIFIEISAGEEKTACSLWQRISVVERTKQQPETLATGLGDLVENATDIPLAKPEREVELILTKREFDSTQPIQFQVRSSRPEQFLVASVSRQGIPVAQFPLTTPRLPGTLASINVPENDSQTGLLQVALFDPGTNPVKELASESVFRRGNRFLKIEKAEESQTLPAAIKITDEKGKPVAAEVRFSWWKGNAPQTEVIPSPVLIDNQRQFHAELESALSKRKPVFAEMLGFFTVLAIIGGTALSGVILVLFFLRRLSGCAPLIFAGITGTTCVLLGVSLMHDGQVLVSTPASEESFVSNDPPTDSEEGPQRVTPEKYEQWTAKSNVHGICPVNLKDDMKISSTLQIEAFTSDEQEGYALWKMTIPDVIPYNVNSQSEPRTE